MTPLFINGRFLAQPVSGVQRYARELIGALDARLARDPALASHMGPVTVLHPAGLDPSLIPCWQVVQARVLAGGHGHLWEQGALGRAGKDGVILSLCGAGPVRQQRQLLVIHDANVFVSPKAYDPLYRWFHRLIRPVLSRHVARVASVSRTAARDLEPYLGLPCGTIGVIPNSADHILSVTPDPTAPGRFGLVKGGYLLTVGNQSPNKNLARLVAAHATTEGPPLAIAGGAAPGLSQSHIANGARVQVLGRVSDAELRALYDGAAGFLWPALREGFGIPPLEAMALGVPVASSNTTAMPEVLGDAALYFNPADTEDIAGAIRRLTSLSTTERATLTMAGRARAAALSWDAAVEPLIAAISDLQYGQLRK